MDSKGLVISHSIGYTGPENKQMISIRGGSGIIYEGPAVAMLAKKSLLEVKVDAFPAPIYASFLPISRETRTDMAIGLTGQVSTGEQTIQETNEKQNQELTNPA
jgi:hypothetical protein